MTIFFIIEHHRTWPPNLSDILQTFNGVVYVKYILPSLWWTESYFSFSNWIFTCLSQVHLSLVTEPIAYALSQNNVHTRWALHQWYSSIFYDKWWITFAKLTTNLCKCIYQSIQGTILTASRLKSVSSWRRADDSLPQMLVSLSLKWRLSRDTTNRKTWTCNFGTREYLCNFFFLHLHRNCNRKKRLFYYNVCITRA